MIKFGKKYKKVSTLIDKNKFYPITEAIELIKKTSITKFDSTIDISFNLNINKRNNDQQIQGIFILPKGTGKKQIILVLTNSKENEAKMAGADFVGGKNLIEKIKKENWFNYDVIIATPDIMEELGKIGKLLGPKGLMPNTNTETITWNITKSINDIKNGKIEYHADKYGNIHSIIGKTSFKSEDLKVNYYSIYEKINNIKPNNFKGIYIKNIAMKTTMGPSIKVLIELN